MGSIGCWSAQRISLVLLSGIASFASFASSACSLTIDPDRQACSDDSFCSDTFGSGSCVQGICQNVSVGGDGGASGSGGGGNGIGSVPGNWSCVGKPPTTVEETGPFKVTMKLTNVLGSGPYPGVTGKLCSKLDVDCKNPVGIQPVSNEGGFMVFPAVNKNYNGYVWLTGPENTPGLYFFNRQVDKDIEEDTPIAAQIVTPSVVTSLTGLLEASQKDGAALSLNSVFDCDGKAAAGVRFVSELAMEGSDAFVFYAVGGIPAKGATETDTSGFGGLINIPPGSVTLHAYVGPEENNWKVATITFTAKPNSISYMRLVPDGF